MHRHHSSHGRAPARRPCTIRTHSTTRRSSRPVVTNVSMDHGLIADDITLPTRIIGLACHVVDQAGHTSQAQLWEQLEADRETVWDPRCLDALRSLFAESERPVGEVEAA